MAEGSKGQSQDSAQSPSARSRALRLPRLLVIHIPHTIDCQTLLKCWVLQIIFSFLVNLEAAHKVFAQFNQIIFVGALIRILHFPVIGIGMKGQMELGGSKKVRYFLGIFSQMKTPPIGIFVLS